MAPHYFCSCCGDKIHNKEKNEFRVNINNNYQYHKNLRTSNVNFQNNLSTASYSTRIRIKHQGRLWQLVILTMLLLLSFSWVASSKEGNWRKSSASTKGTKTSRSGGGGRNGRGWNWNTSQNSITTSTTSNSINTNVTKSKMIDVEQQIMNDMGTAWHSEAEEAKIIPDEHHVSSFLQKGISKLFLFVNEKDNNPVSIVVTPCTSILLWTVKFWPFLGNLTKKPENVEPKHLKTYRTQRITTFSEEKAKRGVYSLEMRPLYAPTGSYVHFYATSFSSELTRYSQSAYFENEQYFHNLYYTNDKLAMSATNDLPRSRSVMYYSKSSGIITNATLSSPKFSTLFNKPRIWARRLRGNRLHVKWDSSPLNPHLYIYCIIVNTRRDYTSLCSATGDSFGVLPPDLMHAYYYSKENSNQKDKLNSGFSTSTSDEDNSNEGFQLLSNFVHTEVNYEAQQFDEQTRQRRHRHQHGKQRRGKRSIIEKKPTFDDIIIGCVNKKTNYILHNLQEGRLYYFNVFIKDLATNVSYPYVRTTLKYHVPKNVPNSLKDAKALKVKIPKERQSVVKFNLNKPCTELTMYVMPCGGGDIVYNLFHGNKSIYDSGSVDSLDIVKVALPQRGKYYLKLLVVGNSSTINDMMAEVYVSKKNKRFPLPRLPAITKISEDVNNRKCDSVTISWWPALDPRDNEYCIFLKEESRKRIFHFKKPNQCDIERSLKSDPYVTLSLCLQRDSLPEMTMLSQKIVGLFPNKTYVVQLIVRRHNGKSLSYDLHYVKTLDSCNETK